MFEPDTEKETEQKRSRLIMAAGALGALVLAGIVVYFTRSVATPSSPQLKLENAVRAGSPEFDSYKAKVALEDQEVGASSNLLGMTQFVVRARLHNRGDRTLTGVEVVGKVYDHEGKIVGQNTSVPIPRARPEPLKPGESVPIIVKVDTPSKIKEEDVKEVKIELQGLRFQ